MKRRSFAYEYFIFHSVLSSWDGEAESHLLFYGLFSRNLEIQRDVDGRRSTGNSRLDDLRFDKVFQDENCVAEGTESHCSIIFFTAFCVGGL